MLRGLAALTLLAAPSVANAAEGMPQLDFANPLTISQIIWLAIIFGVLYLLLSRWALPRVGSVLEKRASKIASDLEAAHTSKAAADMATAEVNASIREAQHSAQARIAEAVSKAKEASASRAAEENKRLQAQLTEAETRIAAAREAALGALRQVASETASVVVARLTGRSADTNAIDAEVGAVMAARTQGAAR